jgi:hypothetical protein
MKSVDPVRRKFGGTLASDAVLKEQIKTCKGGHGPPVKIPRDQTGHTTFWIAAAVWIGMPVREF